MSENNRQVKLVDEEQPHHYHPERFESFVQVFCSNGLTGRCYWEFEVNAKFYVAVAYRGISRRGEGNECRFGGNEKSWSLYYYRDYCEVWHNNAETKIDNPNDSAKRVAVYLDWPAGTVSFYTVSSDKLSHLYTLYSRFTEPLYPGFGFELWSSPHMKLYTIGSRVSLVQLDQEQLEVEAGSDIYNVSRFFSENQFKVRH